MLLFVAPATFKPTNASSSRSLWCRRLYVVCYSSSAAVLVNYLSEARKLGTQELAVPPSFEKQQPPYSLLLLFSLSIEGWGSSTALCSLLKLMPFRQFAWQKQFLSSSIEEMVRVLWRPLGQQQQAVWASCFSAAAISSDQAWGKKKRSEQE